MTLERALVLLFVHLFVLVLGMAFVNPGNVDSKPLLVILAMGSYGALLTMFWKAGN